MGRTKIWSEASINCEWPTWIKFNILILLAVSDDTLIIVLAVIATSAVIESFSNK